MKKLIIFIFIIPILSSSCINNSKPVKLVNEQASLPATFNFDKLGLKVMTSSVNKKQNTMSTLYANTLGLKNAIKGLKQPIIGETFALITWKRQADDHWFGANIPGELQSLELVNTLDKTVSYTKYTGKTLAISADTLNKQERISYILSAKPSVMP